MSEKPEALRLADKLSSYKLSSGYASYCHKAAAELRRQYAEIERLRDEVRVLRLYGNKDCTAMADEAMKEAALRQEETT
jgi:hypothetical protein